MTAALPRLELDPTPSDFDEAVILIDGHEEETIRFECTGAAELAARLAAIANGHAETTKALTAAMHALRSYQFSNASPELAESTADYCEQILKQQSGAAA
jgi:hypothetical protein